MKKWLVCFFVVCFSLPSFGAGLLRNDIRQFLSKARKAYRVPGLSVALIRNHRLVYLESNGYQSTQKKRKLTNQGLFQLGSVSQLYTSILILRLVQQKKLRLEQDITTFFPKLAGKSSVVWKHVTIRKLLLHQSRLPSAFCNCAINQTKNTQEMFGEVKREGLSKPWLARLFGEKHVFLRTRYSNANYWLLGKIAEKATKLPFATLLKKEVIKPLKLVDTFVNAPKDRIVMGHRTWFGIPEQVSWSYREHTVPASGIYTSIRGLAQFVMFLQSSRKRKMFLSSDAWKLFFQIPNGHSCSVGSLPYLINAFFRELTVGTWRLWSEASSGYVVEVITANGGDAAIVLANSSNFFHQVTFFELKAQLLAMLYQFQPSKKVFRLGKSQYIHWLIGVLILLNLFFLIWTCIRWKKYTKRFFYTKMFLEFLFIFYVFFSAVISEIGFIQRLEVQPDFGWLFFLPLLVHSLLFASIRLFLLVRRRFGKTSELLPASKKKKEVVVAE